MAQRYVTAFMLCLILAPVEAAPVLAQDALQAPEADTGISAKSQTVATRHMVAAAHPLAAEAGREILRQGGSALDAAIATQLVLGLVEPQSSGLGGGAFIVHWDEAAKDLKTYDGRETAPAAAKPDRFLRDGKPMDFDEAVRSGLSAGVPGLMRVLELAHQRHGKLSWSKLFEPAIRMARNGFLMPARLHLLLKAEGPTRFSPGARSYFFDDTGAPHAPGKVITNPAYAETLATIAGKGAAAFYEGAIADAIVAAVAQAPIATGDVTRDDLKAYQAKERAPFCFKYRTRKICGMGPPSSGAMTIAQTLQMIEPIGGVGGRYSAMSAQALHIIAEAQKLSYADRNRYLADPDFVSIPSGLLDPGYLDERRKLIDLRRAMAKPAAGMPPGLAKRTFGIDATVERAGTSHISIVDERGNAVAMTTTIEGAFGSHLWAAGFLLNNELTDFSFMPLDKDGLAVANRIEGGKRPRSSMSPTIVFDKSGALEIVTGSPGGSNIILYVTKMLVALIDWELSAQEAAALPNFGSDGAVFQFEDGASAFWPSLMLKAYGHEVVNGAMTSGTHTIVRRNGRLEGGADPRREGAALGD